MNLEIAEHREPRFDTYQKELFLLSQQGSRPTFNTHPDKLEEQAKKKLSGGGYLYAACNAGVDWTHKANRDAFYRWKIIPRMLVDTTRRDTTIELFGHKIAAPVLFVSAIHLLPHAPIGINKIYNELGELNASKVAGELNIPYCLSSAGSQPIEEVARVNGNGPRFFQLYCPHDEELEDSLLNRAWNSGFDVCIFTLDTWQLAWRHDDIANSNYAFYRGIGAEIGLTDPVFVRRLKEHNLDPGRIEDMPKIGELWIDQIWHGKAFTWDKVEQLVKKWKKISGGRPFLLKGIQDAGDARKAIEMGCDGVVCSNHAGRQVDGAIASLDALPDIVKGEKHVFIRPQRLTVAVGEKGTVLFDSGVRTGADVFKALALGAKAVCVGRLYVFGMAIAGEAGVRHVMKSLLADFDILMNCAGVASVKDITRDRLKYLPSPPPQ